MHGRSVTLSLGGGWVGWMVDGVIGLWVGRLVCWLFLCGLVGWLFALLTDGFGCFMCWWVAWLVACVGQVVSESFG